MSIFHREDSPNPRNKRCRFIASVLKDAFSQCRTAGRLSTAIPEDESPATDFVEELEVMVSAIRSRAMEAKLRRKASLLTDSFWWVFSTTTGELFIAPRAGKQEEPNDGEGDDEEEDFLSVASCFSSSCNRSMDEFLSVKTNFSCCPDLQGFEFPEYPRRSIIQELCYCEGWPFGLGRKGLLLPPLPKSPSESWSWRKRHSKNSAKVHKSIKCAEVTQNLSVI